MYENKFIEDLQELNYEFNYQELELYKDISINNNLINFTSVTIDSYYQDSDNILFVVASHKYTDIKHNNNINNLDQLQYILQSEISNIIVDTENINIFDNFDLAYLFVTKILKADTLENQLKKDNYKLI